MDLGIVSLVAFPLWEIHAPRNTAKLCPPEVVKNVRGVSVPMLVMFVSGMTVSIWIHWTVTFNAHHLPADESPSLLASA